MVLYLPMPVSLWCAAHLPLITRKKYDYSTFTNLEIDNCQHTSHLTLYKNICMPNCLISCFGTTDVFLKSCLLIHW